MIIYNGYYNIIVIIKIIQYLQKIYKKNEVWKKYLNNSIWYLALFIIKENMHNKNIWKELFKTNCPNKDINNKSFKSLKSFH